MTSFTSSAQINAPVEEVYAFLEDFNRHQSLMPDSIQNWKADHNVASFDIKGMASLHLHIVERQAGRAIRITPAAKAPFDLELRWDINPIGDAQTQVVLTLQAQLNAMMKMMASGPLKKLVEHQTRQLIAAF